MLEPHSPLWRDEFLALRAVYLDALGPLATRVEHIGSTAVAGLMAKPIIDIDIVIPDHGVFAGVTAALARLGYSHRGDQGIPEREVFKPADEFAPTASPARKWMKHHLYVLVADSAELRRHLCFRDALRKSADLRARYELKKLDLASRSNGDRRYYAQLKQEECREFFAEIFAAEMSVNA